jgi:ubiquinone biosynthesis protein
MDDLGVVLLSHRARLQRIADVLTRYGLAEWVNRVRDVDDLGILGARLAKSADSGLAGLTKGERLRGALVDLGTTWVKFGQMLSLRPDMVGPDVARELELLQANVPADPPGVARSRVESELKAPTTDLFAAFDPEPFASGSVAQVHHAELHDGTPVVVKVLHDGTDRLVRDDLDLMAALAGFLQDRDAEMALYRPVDFVSQFATMMRSAIDLSQERSNLEKFAANFAAEPDVVVPLAFPALSTPRVLTMSEVTGSAISDRASVEATGWDVETLTRRATNIYLEMIFRDGLYHADPHPGNFLIPDSKHLAILDFGDVGRLSAPRRRQLESLIIAGAARDDESIADILIEMTTPPPGTDLLALRADIEAWMNRYLLAEISQMDVAGIIGGGVQVIHQHKLVLPSDLPLLFRVLLNLQSLGQGMGAEVGLAELLKPYVEQIAIKRFDPRRIGQRAARGARAWERLFEDSPHEIRAILDQVRTGQLAVDFRVRDVDGAVDALIDGLIAAASIVASAQLIGRRSGPVMAGISLPGLVAAGVGVATWQRLAARRQGHQSVVSRTRRLAELVTSRPDERRG